MDDLREKVIKGLECCTNGGDCQNQCDEWPDNGCVKALMRSALSLLKAQEPRVMTLEEVAGCVALERETPIYMEFGYLATHAGQVIGLIPKYMYFDDENGLSWNVCEGPDQGKKDGVALCEYNDIWRCWTSRPTDEQRKAVKRK